ncbi:MAG: hypothetical protein QW474_02305 [Candidatus Aenigmatarchaeota archaeon]|nr:hypothetical protein [Candidatus Aenigmarchaeota archaeon]
MYKLLGDTKLRYKKDGILEVDLGFKLPYGEGTLFVGENAQLVYVLRGPATQIPEGAIVAPYGATVGDVLLTLLASEISLP